MSEEHKEAPPVDEDTDETPEKFESTVASRARNRTVMLTPDVAGQVRSLIAGEGDAASVSPSARRDALNELLPPAHPDFERPRGVPSGRASGSRADQGSMQNTPWRNVQEPSHSGRPQFGPNSPLHSVSQGYPPPSREVRSADLRTAHGGVAAEPGIAAPPARKPRVAKSKIIGFLISYDRDKFGEIFELRTGRWLITSRPIEHGEYILMEDDSISPLHGILRVTDDGKIQILDQLSEFGTGVTPAGASAETEVAGAMTNIHHGDVVRFGKRRFVTCLVPATSEA